jgi:acetyl-CoA acetyltransferase
MEDFGSTEEHLGAVVAACSKHAARNPQALRTEEISVADYLETPYVNAPLRALDCFISPCSGACAFVVTTAERAQELRRPPAYISGAVTAAVADAPPYWELYSMRRGDITGSAADVVSDRLWKQTGLTPDAVDVAQIYDCYSYTVLSQLEGYGFCDIGEGGDFAENGRLELGGDLPVNTHGGHLREVYMHGMNHILEGVRQVRGDSTGQVDGASTVLVTGGPGPISSALILTKERA